MAIVKSYSYRQGGGQSHQFKGTAPTERADGTPLDPSEIDHYVRLVTRQDPVTGNWSATEHMDVQLVDGKFSEVVDIDALTLGTYAYWYRTVDTGGQESSDSDSLQMEVLAPLAAPNPPTIIG